MAADQTEELQILGGSPLFPVDLGVQMVDPLLPALLRGSVVAFARSHEQTQGYLAPPQPALRRRRQPNALHQEGCLGGSPFFAGGLALLEQTAGVVFEKFLGFAGEESVEEGVVFGTLKVRGKLRIDAIIFRLDRLDILKPRRRA